MDPCKADIVVGHWLSRGRQVSPPRLRSRARAVKSSMSEGIVCGFRTELVEQGIAVLLVISAAALVLSGCGTDKKNTMEVGQCGFFAQFTASQS